MLIDFSLFQDKLAELELQHSNLQELLGVLRDQSRGASSTATKLTEWHAKLGELRMREAKAARTNERCAVQTFCYSQLSLTWNLYGVHVHVHVHVYVLAIHILNYGSMLSPLHSTQATAAHQAS